MEAHRPLSHVYRKVYPHLPPLVKLKIALSEPGGCRRWLEKERIAGRYEPELGITPARAGKSSLQYRLRSSEKDHPRVRGEKFSFSKLRT